MSKRTKKPVPDKVINGTIAGANRMVWVASSVGAVVAAVITVHQGWPVVEPYMVATHDFVRTTVEELVKKVAEDQSTTNIILRSIQIEQAEGKLDATKDAITQWTIKRGDPTNAGMAPLIDQHLKELQSSVGRLQDQVETLKKIRAKEH